MSQSAKKIILVRPFNFVFNHETALSNAFQNQVDESNDVIIKKAFDEFEQMAQKLRQHGVEVTIFDDTPFPAKPDAVFPNNWVTFHADGKVVLYPMQAKNRRLERRIDIIEALRKTYQVSEVCDLSYFEEENKFLEGTGSIVFDHLNKLAYACLSPRTDKEVLQKLCDYINYVPVAFYAHDANGQEIYHTNVMMCMGNQFVVICSEAITDIEERNTVLSSLKDNGHEAVEISFDQMNHFAGNMLVVNSNTNEKVIALSQSAYDILSDEQRATLSKYAKLCPLPITTIETIGGGSVRCMMAENFLPLKD